MDVPSAMLQGKKLETLEIQPWNSSTVSKSEAVFVLFLELVLGVTLMVKKTRGQLHTLVSRVLVVILAGKPDGPRLPGGLIIYQGHLFP